MRQQETYKENKLLFVLPKRYDLQYTHYEFSAEVREQVYETLRKNCSGYENTKEIEKQLFSASALNVESNQQLLGDIPKLTNEPASLQSHMASGYKPMATNITGIAGFSSPFNARKQPSSQDFTVHSKNDAMALYARVDRTKKKKNRDSGGGSR